MCSKTILWALMLFRTIYAAEELTIHQPDSVITAQLGESVTLQCNFTKGTQYMFWYKQKPGERPQVMVRAHVLSDSEFQSGFSKLDYNMQRGDGVFHLTIKNTTTSDEASYFCATRDSYDTIFGNGTFLALRDHRNHRLDLTAVIQTPVPAPAHSSDPQTLDCTVLTETRTEEVSVFWFRPASGDSHPEIIYVQKNCSNSQRCVYRLPIGQTSDSGTFYCAVVSYGHLLFGNRIKLDKQHTEPVDPVVVSLGAALSLCIVGLILLAYLRCKRTTYKDCKVNTTRGHTHLRAQSAGQTCDAEMLNYSALQFTEGRSKTGRKKKPPLQESTYSDIRSTRS
ncbi:M1-specific T cell receptor beta chain-like [Sardina pilchardus]|uniref:M1-specific T cell receptor beta chain-like n=1 Tax=Sardina pilchardus TaxID=27697 RepID=UPI002E14520C